MFCLKHWNSATWTEIPNTETFLRTLKEQMENKTRVKDKALSMKLSFGRSKAGFEFKDHDDFDMYIEEGDALEYSQTEIPGSPFLRNIGAAKREDSWNKPHNIINLVGAMYTARSCKLYYGFLKEHGNSFLRIISANLSIHKDASPFMQSLIDPVNNIPTDELIEEHILQIYGGTHGNDVPGYMPETSKYPPTNEAMVKVPPTLREWKQSQQQNQHHSNFDAVRSALRPDQLPLERRHQFISPAYASHSSGHNHGGRVDEIVALTFKIDEEEVSVMIEDPLSSDSTMELVMKDGDVFEEFGLASATMDDDSLDSPVQSLGRPRVKYLQLCKFLIKRQGEESYLTLKWDKFKRMTVMSFTRIKNIHDDYLIIIKNSNK